MSEGVIVETFERGAALHEFLRKRSSLNTQVSVPAAQVNYNLVLTLLTLMWHIVIGYTDLLSEA